MDLIQLLFFIYIIRGQFIVAWWNWLQFTLAIQSCSLLSNPSKLGNFVLLIHPICTLSKYFIVILTHHAIFVSTFAAFTEILFYSLFLMPSKSPPSQYTTSHTLLTSLLYPLLNLCSHQYSDPSWNFISDLQELWTMWLFET